MPDIKTRQDIDLIVREFYDKLMVDDVIGHFFTEVVPIDLEEHLPIIANFWEAILLFNPVYHGNPMLKHIEMNRKSPMKPEHFQRWLKLWEETVSAHFEGKNAAEAISRAKGMSDLMEYKVGLGL